MDSARPIRRARAVIIGDKADPHVVAVLTAQGKAASHTVVADASTLAQTGFRLDDDRLRIDLLEGAVELGSPARGWIRRFAPDGWYHGLVIGSEDAATKTSWLALLAATMRTCGLRWLTHPDRMVTTEDKLWQGQIARGLGIPVPPTMVASSVVEVANSIGEPFIVKPLGPAEFVDRGELKAVFTTEFTRNHPAASVFAAAPFIAQRHLNAERHLRVVTVADSAWVCSLEATNSLDWRCDHDSHLRFTACPDRLVSDNALSIANAMGVGYSSQDWIVEDGTPYFVDLNPAGQWLFLPTTVANEIANALAAWLGSGSP